MKNIFSHPRIPYPGHSNIQQIDKDQKIMQNRYYNVPVKKKYIYIYIWLKIAKRINYLESNSLK